MTDFRTSQFMTSQKRVSTIKRQINNDALWEDEISACLPYQTQRNSVCVCVCVCVCKRERVNQNCPVSCRAIKESVTTVHYPPPPTLCSTVLRIHSHIVVPQLENKQTKTTSLPLYSIHSLSLSLSLFRTSVSLSNTLLH